MPNSHIYEVTLLKELPDYIVGQKIITDDKIGTMGSSGQSQFSHLHIDVVEGFVRHLLRLKDIGYEKMYKPNIKQLNYFMDEDLFNHDLTITTYFYDPDYNVMFGKDHPGYDVVPSDRYKTDEHFDIFWNRSKEGKVLSVGYDEKGYGNYMLVGFET